MNIGKESLSTFVTGQGVVGTTEVPLTPHPLPVARHVVIRASETNSNFIFVGPRNAAESNGYPLAAGEQTPPIHVNSTEKVGVIAGGANQQYTFILS